MANFRCYLGDGVHADFDPAYREHGSIGIRMSGKEKGTSLWFNREAAVKLIEYIERRMPGAIAEALGVKEDAP
jgi:hypothetical protein